VVHLGVTLKTRRKRVLIRTSAVRSSVIVRVVPYQPHSLAFGGFEVQMLATSAAIRAQGVDIAPLDFWSRDANYDVLHLWGLGPAHKATIDWARQARTPVLVTALLPYLSPIQRLSRQLRSRTGLRNDDIALVSSVARLVVVNDRAAQSAETLYGIPLNRLRIIPSIVSDPFFEPIPVGAHVDFGITEFFVCVGNVCERKNQLALAQAAALCGVSLLVVGESLPGENRYAESLAIFISRHPNMRWIRGLPPESIDLRSAYAQSVGVVLVSLHESQPLTGVEAVAMRRPLILSDRLWARQPVYARAKLVEPRDPKAIAMALRQVRETPEAFTTPLENIESCRSDAVAKAYVQAYAEVLVEAR
jgi:glycosyltransferase involved in cell wall biosynthesis